MNKKLCNHDVAIAFGCENFSGPSRKGRAPGVRSRTSPRYVLPIKKRRESRDEFSDACHMFADRFYKDTEQTLDYPLLLFIQNECKVLKFITGEKESMLIFILMLQ